MHAWITDRAPIVAGIAGAAIVAAVAMATRPPSPTIEVRPREQIPSPTTMIYVHVAGAVAAPGVVSLPQGSRVFEAIQVAGGETDEADTTELNLAAPLVDGQKLVIPKRPGPTAFPIAAADPAAPSEASPEPAVPTVRPAPQSAAAASARINVNTASQRMLESLPGVGPVTARRIVEHREANGPFVSVEQMRDLRIINNSVYERIKDLVTTQ